ncbi:MAG TPA: hypothetical protein DIU15_05190 [Deltaproteobacteria bacterium]|nr:hypothetical protein [Deltaproteobacteria bacterium]HCP45412.1 hypothetical protein [Deltaproteobacteria bacterium]
MATTALVTGANGFIGSHLVEYLQDRGDLPYAMVRKTSNTDNLAERNVDYRYASVGDIDSLVSAMADVEVVYHVAGITAAFDEATLQAVNAQGTANVLEAARRASPGPRRVVVVSSLEAAGESHPEVARAEHHRPTPFTWYGKSKLGGEKAAWEAAQQGGLEIVIVRPPLVYGPRDQDVLQMIQSANWRIVARPGFSDTWMSAIHPHDLVRGIVLAAEKGRPLPSHAEDHVLGGGGDDNNIAAKEPSDPRGEGIYFFSDGGQHTIASFGHEAARALGKKAITVPTPRAMAWTAAIATELSGRLRGQAPALNRDKVKASFSTGWWCDSARAQADLGYAPEMSLEQGLVQTVRWLRDHNVL